jgi:hypothetical protein
MDGVRYLLSKFRPETNALIQMNYLTYSLLEPFNFKLEPWVKGHLVHKPVHVPVPVMVESISNIPESGQGI